MNIIKHLFISRGIKNTLSRAVAVSKRFGITPRKIEACLNTYVNITEKFNCIPTFPTTAITLRRHPELIRKLRDRGVEFAIHGYVHTDYSKLSSKKQKRHLEKAIDIFKNCRIPFKGFRFPYLCKNRDSYQTLISELKFLYGSNQLILWDVINKSKYGRQTLKIYNKVLNLYKSRNAKEFLVLPRLKNGFVEIPLSAPDDESIIDRLGITHENEISEIWEEMLQETYRRGELFTLQLHHERISFCKHALKVILQQARELNPSVWIATLREIAEWWKEKDKFTFEITEQNSEKYKINLKCLERATVLVRNCKVNKPTSDWTNGYKSIDDRNFTTECSTRPFIGVEPDSSKDAISFLRSEGFVVEESEQPNDYGIYFDNLADFEEKDEKKISEIIENSNAPLLRFWRWPNEAKSALAITGDIDSITLIDFIMRLFRR